MSTNLIRLCEPATTLEADVLSLYQGAFPAAQREPVERLSKLLAEGMALHHRTVNEKGELLCFTFVSLADNFAFLSYMATDPTRRSGGIGTKHLTRLLELLKQQFPQFAGLVFEIEATNPSVEVLSELDRTNRLRRRAFYERAGARVICEDGRWLTPHYSDRTKEWEGELLAFEFGDEICGETLTSVVTQIFSRFYSLSSDHPLVQKVLSYFGPCIAGCHESADQTAEDTATPAKPEEEPTTPPAATENETPANSDEANGKSGCGCWLWAALRWLKGLLRALSLRRSG